MKRQDRTQIPTAEDLLALGEAALPFVLGAAAGLLIVWAVWRGR